MEIKLPTKPMEVANWVCPFRVGDIGTYECPMEENTLPCHGCSAEGSPTMSGTAENAQTKQQVKVCRASSGKKQLECYKQTRSN